MTVLGVVSRDSCVRLDEENEHLCRAVYNLTLDKSILEECMKGNFKVPPGGATATI